MSVPTAKPGPTYLFVKWDPPLEPNGPITGYFLYKDGLEMYKGGQQYYNVTDLQVSLLYCLQEIYRHDVGKQSLSLDTCVTLN